MLKVISRQGVILGGKRGAMLVRQLLGVEPDAEAMMRGSLEQPLHLVPRERDRIAIGVNACRNALLGRGGNELVHDLADVMSAPVTLVGRDGVKSEQRRHDPDRFSLAELGRDLEQPELALGIEPVS